MHTVDGLLIKKTLCSYIFVHMMDFHCLKCLTLVWIIRVHKVKYVNYCNLCKQLFVR